MKMMKSNKTRTEKVQSVKKLINEKMSFAEVMQKYPEAANVFFKHGMACFGCPAAMQETLKDGISAHGQNVKKIIDELNKAIKKKK